MFDSPEPLLIVLNYIDRVMSRRSTTSWASFLFKADIFRFLLKTMKTSLKSIQILFLTFMIRNFAFSMYWIAKIFKCLGLIHTQTVFAWIKPDINYIKISRFYTFPPKDWVKRVRLSNLWTELSPCIIYCNSRRKDDF